MKLLIVCQYFYPEQFRINDVCFSLAEMGHNVTVLTGLPNYPMGEIFDGYTWPLKERETIGGVHVYRCNLRPRKSGNKNLALNYLSFAWQGRKTARRIVQSIRQKEVPEFDHIIVFQYSPVTMALPAIYLKKKLNKPLTIYCFDLWPESIVSAGLPATGSIYSVVKLLSKWIYKQCDQLWISSRNFHNYFSHKLGLRLKTNYLPIYAEELFSQISDTPKLVQSDEIHLLFAGNIGKMQSVETILYAAQRLKDFPNLYFDIVGDGTALNDCKRLKAELSLSNVIFHGRHDLTEMPGYYAMADAFLITLKRDPFISYTLPGKVQSYMAAGKPLLAAADGEICETITTAGCGNVCAAEDSESFASIIREFVSNPSSHQKYGQAARQYYDQHFSKQAFFHNLDNLLE